MSPDKKSGRGARTKREKKSSAIVKTRPSADAAHEIVYFTRTDGTAPGREFINSLPTSARAKIRARLIAVAEAPPKRFAGGGYWEAMHDDMTGWFEIRVDGRNREHHRVFCRLDYEAKNNDKENHC